MKLNLLVLVFFISTIAHAQNHKTKNEIIILMDGYRWQELFRGADSSLLFGKKYNRQDYY